jgi:aerobic carbon-monoxide dehydrogenase small subunit
LQCGYCTPGMLATAYDIVTRLPGADEARIREELAGNLCRCTGYVGIVAAIREVLASGPHRKTISATVPAPLPLPFAASAIVTPGAGAAGIRSVPSAIPSPQPITGGITLKRSVAVPVSADLLWATLQDIPTVARCLPGASIESVTPDGTIVGAFEVAIGPMRARFRGSARVTFASATRSGDIRGAGGDGDSRSRADGAIGFAVTPMTADRSGLALDMTYKLSGPLAQFGRPVVVANVVDRLLGDVANNLARAASGATVTAAPIGGVRLLFDMLFGIVRRLLSKP